MDLPDLSSIAVSEKNDAPRQKRQAPIDDLDNIEIPDDLDNMPPMEGGQMMPAEPPPAPLTPEQIKKHFELRCVLALYFSKFSEDLSIIGPEFSPEMLTHKTVDELEDLRNRADILLGASSAIDNKKKLFNSCVWALEKVTISSGYNTYGMTGVLLQDKDFQKDLTRLSLKYLTSNESSAEVTCFLKVVSTAIQCSAENEIKQDIAVETKQIQQAANILTCPPEIPKSNPILEINNKFNDL